MRQIIAFSGQSRLRLIGVGIALCLALPLAASLAPAAAGILDPLNPFSNGRLAPVTPEDQARGASSKRRALRPSRPRLSMNVPFISEAAIARCNRASNATGRSSPPAAGRRCRPEPRSGSATQAPRSSLVATPTRALRRSCRRRPQLALRSGVSGRAWPLPDPQRPPRLRLSRFSARSPPSMSRGGAAAAARDQPRPRPIADQHQQGAALRPRQRARLYPSGHRQRRGRAHSNVVVGKPTRATPEVSASIIEVNFYPYWTCPEHRQSRPDSQTAERSGLFRQRAFQRVGERRLRSIRTASIGAGRRPRTTASSRSQAPSMRSASCASTCRTSTPFICTTRR